MCFIPYIYVCYIVNTGSNLFLKLLTIKVRLSNPNRSVYFFFTSTDKPVTKESVTVFQYSRKMSAKKKTNLNSHHNILSGERQFDELSFKRSLVGERKLGHEL